MTNKYDQIADRLQQWGSDREDITSLREKPSLTQEDIDQSNKGLKNAQDLVNDLKQLINGLEHDIEHAVFALKYCEENMLLIDQDDPHEQ